jgi:polysaccharide pyruvyl transferase WcaK-like protein
LRSSNSQIRQHTEFLLAKLAGKKLVIYGQSAGPFKGLFSRLFLKLIYNQADLIIVRDDESKNQLEKLGINNVQVTADPVFAFPKPEKPKREKRIVLVPRIWTKEHRKCKEKYIAFLVGLSNELLDNGRKVVVLPAASEDLEFHKKLRIMMPKQVSFIEKVHSPREIANYLAESEFLISSRMHPIILGSLSGTPFFAIGWEYKLNEISKMLGAYSVKANMLDGTARIRILKAIEDSEEIGARIKRNTEELSLISNNTPDILQKSIENWKA